MKPINPSRRLLLGAAGLGAGALGLGLAAWRHRGSNTATALSADAQAFWAASFERPEGGQLAARSLRGQPLLVNFWATWCAPCVHELPALNEFQREQQGAQAWRVLGLAVDAPTPVRDFLKKQPLNFAIGLAGLTGTDLARTLGNSQGGLPFSVAFDAHGEVVWRKLGASTLGELRELAAGRH